MGRGGEARGIRGKEVNSSHCEYKPSGQQGIGQPHTPTPHARTNSTVPQTTTLHTQEYVHPSNPHTLSSLVR